MFIEGGKDMVLIIVFRIGLRIIVLPRRVKILFIEIRYRFHAPVMPKIMKSMMRNQRIKEVGQKLKEMADNFSANDKSSRLTPNVSFWNRHWKFMLWLTTAAAIVLFFIFPRLYQDAT
ncbi:hypothetical protein X975_25973, partial [Stegodyphus mimosarum]